MPGHTRKVIVVGLGHVGSTLAHVIVTHGFADEVVLVNRTQSRADGDALDLSHAASLAERNVLVTSDPAEAKDADLIVLCASVAKASTPPDRLAMAEPNAELFYDILPPMAKANPAAVVLVITNPVDVLTRVALDATDFPSSRVMGLGTLIDSARFRFLLSQEFGVHTDDVRAYILGEHGDSQLAALSVAVVGGERIGDTARVREIMQETVRSGHQVLQAKGYTNFAVASAAAMVVETITGDLRRTLPLSVQLDGYLGVDDVCLSVPVAVGRQGVTRVFFPPLDESEADAFRRSAEIVGKITQKVLRREE